MELEEEIRSLKKNLEILRTIAPDEFQAHLRVYLSALGAEYDEKLELLDQQGEISVEFPE